MSLIKDLLNISEGAGGKMVLSPSTDFMHPLVKGQFINDALQALYDSDEFQHQDSGPAVFVVDEDDVAGFWEYNTNSKAKDVLDDAAQNPDSYYRVSAFGSSNGPFAETAVIKKSATPTVIESATGGIPSSQLDDVQDTNAKIAEWNEKIASAGFEIGTVDDEGFGRQIANMVHIFRHNGKALVITVEE